MVYSKKELADICGVSVTAIDKKLRKSGMIEECPKVANKLQIPWDVAATVATDYSVVLQPQQPQVAEVAEVAETSATAATTEEGSERGESRTVEALIRELEILHKQLEVKDRQIADLSAALVASQESNKALSANAAMHTAADKRDELALETAEQNQERKTRWQRLKEAWRG